MSISTNGKILLQDEISTFAKFIDIEVITYVIVPTVHCDNISNSLFFFLKKSTKQNIRKMHKRQLFVIIYRYVHIRQRSFFENKI